MKSVSLMFLLAFATVCSAAGLDEVIPIEVHYNDEVPTPSSVLGYEIGEWHVRHDQLTLYAHTLAAGSPRVSVWETGRSHENRQQLVMAITSEENQARLEELKQAHKDYALGNSDQPGPMVVWLGYSIHGNEASGANASMAVAYHLAAADDDDTIALLNDTIVLIDPSLNPDGLGRFAHWVNSNRSKTLSADPNNREHREVWPGGRFNHYGFDLNRDWLLLAHPESRSRVAVFQDWMPHIFGDFHEMGSNSTYFFQPGVPERQNPLTPVANFDLTSKLAEYHAAAFDQVGQLYFSQEQFDDYYYGKGSTYPDIQGSIGILFEQASSRAHLRDTVNGELRFPITIRNQVITSFSTLEGAHELRDEIRTYQRQFIADAQSAADRAGNDAYVFGDPVDQHRARTLASILSQHNIDVFELSEAVEINGSRIRPGYGYVVPMDQRQNPLIEAVFETRTTFQDTTFYDVSSWTLPLAFDLDYERNRNGKRLAGSAFSSATPSSAGSVSGGGYAYAFDWDHYLAPKALQRLLSQGARVRTLTKPVTALTKDGQRQFQRGTIVIATDLNRHLGDELITTLNAISQEDGIPVIELTSGLTPVGIDLGSANNRPLAAIKPLLITGTGVHPSESGEVWHLLDTRIAMPLTMVDIDRFNQVNLDEYTHILMVDGNYQALSNEGQLEALKSWVRGGGIIVASKRASAWVTDQLMKTDEDKKNGKPKDESEAVQRRPYADFQTDFSKAVIGGAIVQGEIDVTHPIAYGYRQPQLALFRNGTQFFEPSENPYETVIQYASEPLISGYIGEERLTQLGGSAAILADRFGGGSIIRFADNPNFRGFWYGTNKLYLNALFFGQILQNTPVPDTKTRK